jgi:hypothetical protein
MWSVKWTQVRDELVDKRLTLIPMTMSIILFAFGLADQVAWEVIIGLGFATICALAPRFIGRFMMGLFGETVKVEGVLVPPGHIPGQTEIGTQMPPMLPTGDDEPSQD